MEDRYAELNALIVAFRQDFRTFSADDFVRKLGELQVAIGDYVKANVDASVVRMNEIDAGAKIRIATVVTAMNNHAASLMDVGKAGFAEMRTIMGTISSDARSLGAANVQEVKAIRAFVGEQLQILSGRLNSSTVELSNGINAVRKDVVTGLGDAKTGLIGELGNIKSAVLSGVGAQIDALKGSIVPTLAKLSADMGAGDAATLGEVRKRNDALDSSVKGVMDRVMGADAKIAGVDAKVVALGVSVSKSLEDARASILAEHKKRFDAIDATMAGIINRIGAFNTAMDAQTKTIIENVQYTGRQSVIQINNLISELVREDAPTSIVYKLNAFNEDIKQAISAAVRGGNTGVLDSLNGVLNQVREEISKYGAGLDDLRKTMTETKDASANSISSVLTMLGDIKTQLNSVNSAVFTNVINSIDKQQATFIEFRMFLEQDIKPSLFKLTEYIQGALLGINNLSSQVSASINSFKGHVTTEVLGQSKVLGDMIIAARSAILASQQTIQSSITNYANSFTTLHSTLKVLVTDIKTIVAPMPANLVQINNRLTNLESKIVGLQTELGRINQVYTILARAYPQFVA